MFSHISYQVDLEYALNLVDLVDLPHTANRGIGAQWLRHDVPTHANAIDTG